MIDNRDASRFAIEISSDSSHAREHLVRALWGMGVDDERVLQAMRRVPRELFVDDPPVAVEQAYRDHPLPGGGGQTLGRPSLVACVAQALSLSEDSRVLELGVGSGYQAAVLAELTPAGEVCGVERAPQLAAQTARRLLQLGYGVQVFCADEAQRGPFGSPGWAALGPYQGIVLRDTFGVDADALFSLLVDGGRLVIWCEAPPEPIRVLERRGQLLVPLESYFARRVLSSSENAARASTAVKMPTTFSFCTTTADP